MEGALFGGSQLDVNRPGSVTIAEVQRQATGEIYWGYMNFRCRVTCNVIVLIVIPTVVGDFTKKQKQDMINCHIHAKTMKYIHAQSMDSNLQW